MERWYKLKLRLHALAVFRQLKNDDVFLAFMDMIDVLADGRAQDILADAGGKFASALYRHGDNWSYYLRTLVMECMNPYVLHKARNLPVGQELEKSLEHELCLLEEISQITSDEIYGEITFGEALPGWQTEPLEFKKEFNLRIQNLPSLGYGIFAKYHMFECIDGKPVPVKHPDAQKLSELTGYQRERDLVINNTVALIEGRPSCNVLLYGDAGTGKSSTIKAIANEYYTEGLRLVEVQKRRLGEIPLLMDELAEIPLKFIVFIDDLSFTDGGDEFTELKAVLEGGLAARGKNIVIYATSNRRHLVRESMQSRRGDDLHVNDTLQEIMSLSARFGLTVTFLKPEKELYLEIVRELAKEYKLDMDVKELERKAEAFAIRHSGRSPRTAKQFIEFEKSQI